MRVSCFFVSVAIIFAQQASAAPIVGLPDLPLIGNENGITHSVSNILEPVPLVGPLSGDVLESKSEGDLLSTAELAGNRGLINDDNRLGEIVHSIERREDQGLLNSLVPVTDSITNMPLLSRVGTLNPTTHRLTSQVGELDGTLPILSDVTNNVSIGLPLNILKRAAGIPFVGSIPGLDMLGGSSESSAASSLPGLSTLSSLGGIPGMGAIGGLTSGLPMGGLIKRDNALGSLPVIGSLPGIGAMTSLPGLSSIPSMSSGTSTPGLSSTSSLLTPLLGGLTSSLI